MSWNVAGRVLVICVAQVACTPQIPASRGQLSPLERKAILQTPSGTPTLTVLSASGEIQTQAVPASELDAFEKRILTQDPGAVIALEGDVEILSPTRNPRDTFAPDENLLFRGKQELGVEAWKQLHPDADGRNVVIGIVDDGVALHRPGLKETTVPGVLKFSGSLNASPAWQLPIRPSSFECDAIPSPDTVYQSASWKLPAQFDPAHLSRRIPFDFSPCGINPELPRAACAEWPRSFPQLNSGPKTLAAQAVLLRDENRWRILVDLNGNGVIEESAEIFAPISENAASYSVLPSGTALAFDIHDGSSYPEPAADHPAPECVRYRKPEALISMVLPHEGTLFGSHGEGVAGVAAGHRIGNRPIDGVAPGAQIFDVHFVDPIGARRYTISEITRALLAAGKRSDIVNLSYSLFFQTPATQIAMSRMMTAILNQTQAIYFFSAGNNGPGRGSMNRALIYPNDAIVVGAYLDPLLAQTTFGSALPHGGVVNYSSRGPSPDGGLGAMVISPLAGIAPASPDRGYQSFSGTSSATPALAGLTARLLSQLKSENLPIRREWVRRALLLSARPLPGVAAVDQGWGLPWLPDAITAYRNLADPSTFKPELEVQAGLSSTGIMRRGIFVRGMQERSDLYTARVLPKLPESWKDSQERADYAEPLAIEATHDWVRVPPALLLNANGARFDISIDWDRLEQLPGEHLAEVRVRSRTTGELRAILPVTLLIPETTQWSGNRVLSVRPGETTRWYIEKPAASAKHLILSRQARNPDQPLCGDIHLHDPSGASFPAGLEGRSSSSREEFAITALESGIYEIVWTGSAAHKACTRTQHWEIHWEWISLGLDFAQKNSYDSETRVELFATTEAPMLRGRISLSKPSEVLTIPLRRTTDGNPQSTWNYQATASLLVNGEDQWSARILRDGLTSPTSRIARLPRWELDFKPADSPRTWNTGSAFLEGKSEEFSKLSNFEYLSADPTAETAVDVEFNLYAFEAGTPDDSAPGVIHLELKRTPGAQSVRASSQDIELVQDNSTLTEFVFDRGEELMNQNWVWNCEFRPYGFDLTLPCHGVRF